MKKILQSAVLACVCFGIGFTVASYLPGNSKDTKKVTGIGGIFFKSRDPKTLKEWYRVHLGLNSGSYGTNIEWCQGGDHRKKGFSLWAPFKETTKYFAPSEKDFMINYRVADLERLCGELRKANVVFTDSIEVFNYGKFVHVMDPENNKIELWEPIDSVYATIGN